MTRVYEKPGVKTVREAELGHLVMSGAGLTVGIIGRSNGKKTEVKNSVSNRGVGNSDNIMTLDSPPVVAVNVSSILKISDVLGGVANYVGGVNKDYVLLNNQIVWNTNSFLRVPYMLSPIISNVGGTLAVGTYYYVMTAYNGNGATIRSNEVSAVVVSGTSTVQLRWGPIDGATGYRIFRSGISGSYTNRLLVDIVGGDNSDYIDTGRIAPSTGTPPIANTALRRPVSGVNYYVDYYYQVFSYNPKQYYSLDEVYRDHGMNSDLGIAARLVIGVPPDGNGAASVWLVAAEREIAMKYVEALNKFERYRIDLLVSLLPIDTQLLAYCKYQSSDERKNECRFFTGPYATTPLGNEVTPNTIIYNARMLDDRRAVYVDNWGYVNIKDEDGSYREIRVDGAYLAAALAGLRSGLRDSAEPMTNKQVYGFTQLGELRLETEMDAAAVEGVCVMWSDKGKILCRHCITTAIDIIENQEENIVGAEDELRRALRDATNKPGVYIGRKLTLEALAAIEITTGMVLGGFFNAGLISGYKGLKAFQNNLEPRQVDVTFEYRPMYALNWIVFKYSFTT